MENIDIVEKQKFAALANEWWDPKGKCRPLHDLNSVRLQFITDRINIEGKKGLDIGCGAGILTESLAKKRAIVTGIDISEELIEAAKNHAQSEKNSFLKEKQNQQEKNSPLQENNYLTIDYQISTAEEFVTHYEQSFDFITCMELLEHVPDPNSLIQACARLIKPNGHLFFSTINRSLKAYFLAIVGAEKILKILPNETHQYEKFIRPQELAQTLRQNQLKMIELSGMHYNPFTNRARLIPDVSVNYLVHAYKF